MVPFPFFNTNKMDLQFFATKLDVIKGILDEIRGDSFAKEGLTVLTTTQTSPTGLVYSSIQVLSDTTIAATVVGSKKGDQSLNLAITAPNTIYGRFTNVTSTGGTVIAYLEKASS